MSCKDFRKSTVKYSCMGPSSLKRQSMRKVFCIVQKIAKNTIRPKIESEILQDDVITGRPPMDERDLNVLRTFLEKFHFLDIKITF